MTDNDNGYDIFICGGSGHFGMLEELLPKLQPFGRVHLASTFLSDEEIERLKPCYDLLHQPRHHSDGYKNFELFCIRDINRIATRPHFIKLDADVRLREDWIDYVNRGIEDHRQAVLFGTHRGQSNVTFELSGPLVRRKCGREIQILEGLKVRGGFYVGKTEFFKQHDDLMQTLHEFLYCFRDGVRVKPSAKPDQWPEAEERKHGPVRMRAGGNQSWESSSEDVLRSFVVHVAGAGDRLRVMDSGGAIWMP
jgi:hypothetical protein